MPIKTLVKHRNTSVAGDAAGFGFTTARRPCCRCAGWRCPHGAPPRPTTTPGGTGRTGPRTEKGSKDWFSGNIVVHSLEIKPQICRLLRQAPNRPEWSSEFVTAIRMVHKVSSFSFDPLRVYDLQGTLGGLKPRSWFCGICRGLMQRMAAVK